MRGLTHTGRSQTTGGLRIRSLGYWHATYTPTAGVPQRSLPSSEGGSKSGSSRGESVTATAYSRSCGLRGGTYEQQHTPSQQTFPKGARMNNRPPRSPTWEIEGVVVSDRCVRIRTCAAEHVRVKRRDNRVCVQHFLLTPTPPSAADHVEGRRKVGSSDRPSIVRPTPPPYAQASG